jgi:hypothetical protein
MKYGLLAGAGPRPASPPARPSIPSASDGSKSMSPVGPAPAAIPEGGGSTIPGRVSDAAPMGASYPALTASYKALTAAEPSELQRLWPAAVSDGALRARPTPVSPPVSQGLAVNPAGNESGSAPREVAREPSYQSRLSAIPSVRERSGAISQVASMPPADRGTGTVAVPPSSEIDEPALVQSSLVQPSDPVPTPVVVASGSGRHNDAKNEAKAGSRFAVPATAADASRMWDDVLAELETLRKFSLLGPFQHARVMSWTANQLELGFPVDAHSMGEMAKESADELRTVLRTLDPAFSNVKPVVRLLDSNESSTAGVRSILEATRERTSAERTRRETEAREHPITKHVLRTFGAQIKEIKTDV